MLQTIIIAISVFFVGFILGWIALKKNWQALLKMIVVVVLIGFPFGWVVGLSVSPVLQTVITSLVVVVASGLSIMSGISTADKAESTESNNSSDSGDEEKRPLKKVASQVAAIDPLPIAILMVAFAIGSTTGVYYRANGMFGTDPELIVERWKNVGLDGKEVAQAIFRSMYPSVNSKDDKSGGNAVAEKAGLGVLFSFEPEVYEELKKSKWLPDEELARHLAAVGDMGIQDLAQKYANRPDILRALVEVLTWKSEEKQ